MEAEGLPLKDETVTTILTHRDAHFGGKFAFMIDYYANGGKGANPEVELERIKELEAIERQLGENMAAMLLSGAEAEAIQKAKDSYKKLRDIYEDEDLANSNARLLADLVLSEEEEPAEEIEAIVAKGSDIVPGLIEIIGNEDFYNPLFPGYGLAPALAVQCLAKIGDKKALYALFEQIGRNDVLDEEAILEALSSMGKEARDFLLKVVQSKPITEDNERAAIALIRFKNDPEVCSTCLHLLQDVECRKTLPLAAFLVLACEGLTGEKERKTFEALSSDPATPSILAADFQVIKSSWKKLKR